MDSSDSDSSSEHKEINLQSELDKLEAEPSAMEEPPVKHNVKLNFDSFKENVDGQERKKKRKPKCK